MSVTFNALYLCVCVCVLSLLLSMLICLQRKDIADGWNYDTCFLLTSPTVSSLENFNYRLLCGVYKMVRLEVFIAVVIHIVIFWVMTSRSVVGDVHFPCNCITYMKFKPNLLQNTWAAHAKNLNKLAEDGQQLRMKHMGAKSNRWKALCNKLVLNFIYHGMHVIVC